LSEEAYVLKDQPTDVFDVNSETVYSIRGSFFTNIKNKEKMCNILCLLSF